MVTKIYFFARHLWRAITPSIFTPSCPYLRIGSPKYDTLICINIFSIGHYDQKSIFTLPNPGPIDENLKIELVQSVFTFRWSYLARINHLTPLYIYRESQRISNFHPDFDFMPFPFFLPFSITIPEIWPFYTAIASRVYYIHTPRHAPRHPRGTYGAPRAHKG